MLKRLFDFLLSLAILVIFLPVILVISLLIKVKLGSPILFSQKRPGLNEKIFKMYKFRSMTDERDEYGALLPDSARLTKFGSFLRASSLDELPGLWNILIGDMSLVGPRPLLVEYLDFYTDKEKVRHQVRPGLTGLAQTSGRNNLAWNERLEIDIKYVENQSFFLDLKILYLTFIKVIKKEDVVVVPSSKFKKLSEERKRRQVFNSPDLPLNLSIKNCLFRIKRDDLLPEFMGGNKVRKNSYILDSLSYLPDVLITNGGAESNHSRVCALMASRLGIKCHLVLHGEKDRSDYLHGNKFFIESTKAEITYVNSNDIARTIESAKEKYKSQGLDVFVMPGGGHSIDGARAYIAAVDELKEEPDYIVFPSGTGATHAGLLAGVKKKRWKTQVIGISIARQAERGIAAINELYAPLCLENNIKHDIRDIIFLDEFTFGGYSKYNTKLIDFINKFTSQTGVPFDPVYSGKALYGLTQLVEQSKIPANSKILFWHTGGLLNLQSSKAI